MWSLSAVRSRNLIIGVKLGLLACFAEQAEGYPIDKCQREVIVYESATGGGTAWRWQAMCFAALFYTIIVFYLGYRCSGWWRGVMPKQQGIDKCVQTQVTPRWWWQPPRHTRVRDACRNV